MSDAADWGPSGPANLKIETPHDGVDDRRESSVGWWILPFAILGSFAWIGIFRLIF